MEMQLDHAGWNGAPRHLTGAGIDYARRWCADCRTRNKLKRPPAGRNLYPSSFNTAWTESSKAGKAFWAIFQTVLTFTAV